MQNCRSVGSSSLASHRLGLDLDSPTGVEQPRYHDHGGYRLMPTEGFSVNTADLIGIGGVGYVDPRSDNVMQTHTELAQRVADDLKTTPRLCRRLGINLAARPYRCCSGNEDPAVDPQCTAKAVSCLVL